MAAGTPFATPQPKFCPSWQQGLLGRTLIKCQHMFCLFMVKLMMCRRYSISEQHCQGITICTLIMTDLL